MKLLCEIIEAWFWHWECVAARAALVERQQTLTITGVRSHAKSF